MAKKIVAKYSAPVPFSVAPLTKRPPRDKSVIEVNCTLPLCVNGSVAAAAHTLGWHYTDVTFDITKGPPALAAALTQAIQDKPDYIDLVGVFPPATVLPELAKAKAAGIKVTSTAGLSNNPAFIECSNCGPYLARSGALVADIVAAKFGTSAPVVAASDLTLPGTADFNRGLMAEEKRLGATKASIVQVSSTNSPAANAAAIVSYLQRNPDTKAVLNDFPDELVGLPPALAKAGLTQKVAYINSGPTAADLAFLKAGTLAATVGIETHAAWWRSVDADARDSVGDPVTPYGGSWFQITTRANLAAVLAAGGNPTVPEPPHYQQAYAKAWKVG